MTGREGRIMRIGLYPTRAGLVDVEDIAWPFAYGTDAQGERAAWNARNGRIYCPGTVDNDISGELILLPLPTPEPDRQ